MKFSEPITSPTGQRQDTSAERPLTSSVDHWGACQFCGSNDGYLNIHRTHWFICHVHRTKWLIGENLFSSWRDQDESTWVETERELSDYREIVPIYPNRLVTSEVAAAITQVLRHFWEDAMSEMANVPTEDEKARHIGQAMLVAAGWLTYGEIGIKPVQKQPA